MLNIYSDSYIADSYSDRAKRKKITLEKYKRLVTDLYTLHYFAVDTVVATRFLNWRLFADHIPVLDCDQHEHMLAACNTLATRNINYALIQSSPDHYWVILDVVTIMTRASDIVRSIPGVDKDYLVLLDKNWCFYLRALPDSSNYPIFGDDDRLTNKLVKNWYNQFKNLWDLPEVQQRRHAEILKKGISDKSINVASADPNFKL